MSFLPSCRQTGKSRNPRVKEVNNLLNQQREVIKNKSVNVFQLLMLFAFYFFVGCIIAFVVNGIYNALGNNDAFIHSIVIGAIVIPVFLILTFLVSSVFWVMVREGRKD